MVQQQDIEAFFYRMDVTKGGMKKLGKMYQLGIVDDKNASSVNKIMKQNNTFFVIAVKQSSLGEILYRSGYKSNVHNT